MRTQTHWVCDKLRPVPWGEGRHLSPCSAERGGAGWVGELGPPVGAATATWWTAQEGEADAWEARRGCAPDRVPPAWTARGSGGW